MSTNTWQPVVFLADCEEEEDGVARCPCGEEYGDCACPGPHQEDEYEYAEFGGKLYARRILTT